MEAFQASITAACPLPFDGAVGNLFAGAVAAVVAAHCAFFSGSQWPADYASEVIGRGSEAPSFDFIIVGGGTAGSLLANRLATNYPSLSVLVIESGDDPGLNSEVPAFVFLNQTGSDWLYETQPDGKSCKGFRKDSCIWSKGKGLGGSSSINAMLYIRGNPVDFNNWKKAGNDGWGYKDVTPYFNKLEKEYGFDKYNFPENPWHGVLEATWLELNYTQHKKPSNEAQIGIRVNKLMVKDGKRLNTAKLYLNGLQNLYVMKNTLVQKVIIDPVTKTATGVEIRHKSGVVMEIKANKEVILSAGSIGTPQLLMLSGIGPKKHLEEKQVPCLVDLPVGKNLQDHVMVFLFLKTNLDTLLTPQMITTYMLQYMLTRSGPLSNIGVTDFMAFINTEERKEHPNIQYLHTYYPMKDNFTMRPFLAGYGYKEEVIQAIEKLNNKSDILGIAPTLLRPKSRGEVLLSDKNPTSRPIIKANYFQHPDDMKTLLKAIKFINKLEQTSVFKALGIQLPELDIKECEEAAEYWECYITHMASSIFHPVGTAKMGPKDDETAVVDNNLLVHGIKNLRVVDASIMPEITSSNTMAPTMMIAEKAAEVIKKHYTSKDEL